MIFDISPSKSGTVSLAEALRLLGFKTCHGCPAWLVDDCMAKMPTNNFRAMEVVKRHDAVVNLLNFAYAALDLQFPDAKFIYLDRDAQAWLASTRRQLAANPDHTVDAVFRNPFIYGRLMHLGCLHTDDPEYLLQTLYRHRRNVLRYFLKHQPGKILFMKITDGWEPLCRFLDRPVPDVAFPCLNVSA